MDIVVENLESLAAGLLAQLPLITLAIVVFLLALLVSAVVRRVVASVSGRTSTQLGLMLGRIAQALVVAAGVLLALWIALPTVRFTDVFASLGVTGIILGFALRDIIENFIAGLLILSRRPFVVGDQITSGAYEGLVEEINFRSTVLRTYDGIRVLIPNGKVFTEAVENRTTFETVRTTVRLGIDQSVSVEAARAIILDVLTRIDGVLTDPAPVVLFQGIGDFTNDLEVLYWTSPPTRLSERMTRSDVTEQLNEALQAAGISFPYPTRTIRFSPEAPLHLAPDSSPRDRT